MWARPLNIFCQKIRKKSHIIQLEVGSMCRYCRYPCLCLIPLSQDPRSRATSSSTATASLGPDNLGPASKGDVQCSDWDRLGHCYNARQNLKQKDFRRSPHTITINILMNGISVPTKDFYLTQRQRSELRAFEVQAISVNPRFKYNHWNKICARCELGELRSRE